MVQEAHAQALRGRKPLAIGPIVCLAIRNKRSDLLTEEWVARPPGRQHPRAHIVSIMDSGVRGSSQSIADVLTGACNVVSDRRGNYRGSNGQYERDRDAANITQQSPQG